MADLTPLESAVLAHGIRSRLVRNINDLDVHMLEAGHESRGRPLVLLLHGFSGARLFLEKGDVAARRGRIPCRSARSAGLRTQHGVGRGL
jgi:hypothetical protein